MVVNVMFGAGAGVGAVGVWCGGVSFSVLCGIVVFWICLVLIVFFGEIVFGLSADVNVENWWVDDCESGGL